MMYGGSNMALWWIVSIVLFVGVVVAIVYALKGLGGTAPSSPADPGSPEDSPREIVNRRYARGEIDRQQYEQLMKDL